MAKIADSTEKRPENSGYVRLFGHTRVGILTSRVHAAVIRSGNELEMIIQERTPDQYKADFGSVLAHQRNLLPIQVVFKPKKPKSVKKEGSHADIAIFDHAERRILIIELKDGNTFDTKKSSGELESLRVFSDWVVEQYQAGYSAQSFLCCFNQEDKNAIVKGSKKRFSVENVMTGRELCSLLEIDYDSLVAERKWDQPENLRYFLTELLKIPEVRAQIVEIMRDQI